MEPQPSTAGVANNILHSRCGQAREAEEDRKSKEHMKRLINTYLPSCYMAHGKWHSCRLPEHFVQSVERPRAHVLAF